MTEDQNDPISSTSRRACAVAAAVLVLAIIGVVAETFPLRRHAKPLRVGFNEFSPYISVTDSGQPEGLAVDVVKEGARRSGQSLLWVRVDDGEGGLRSGKIDLYPLLTVSASRLGRFHFSEYWWQNSLELISPQQRPINRARDTAGKKIGLRMKGFVVNLANGLFPSTHLVVKPDTGALLNALCAGEVDALLADVRTIERRLADRPPGCQDIKLKITSVAGATLPLGTASTQLVRNRADLLYARINEILADGTLANLASNYGLASPDSNQQLAQLVRNRQHYLVLEGAFLGVCCLLALLVLNSLRMQSAQRAAEEVRLKLDESEQRFHAFMDHLSANAFMKDSAGRIVYVNDAFCKVLHLLPEECLGKTNGELMARPVAEQVRANDRLVIESNCARQFTETVPDHSGKMRQWLSFKFPFRSCSGESFLGGIALEITEMMQVQNALRESEERYRQIVEFAGEIILRCDARGRLSYINEMGARVLKFPAAVLLGRRALDLIPRDERKRVLGVLLSQLRTTETDVYLEFPVTIGDGSVLWLGQTIRVLRAGGVFRGFQAVSRDITERRRMVAELRASEERFRLLYENGPVAYHEIDRQGVIRRVNRAECELLGIPAAELVGRSVLELIIPEDREMARAAVAAKLNEQLPLGPFIRTYLRPDGRRVRVEIHENLLRDEGGKVIGIHSVLLDVTQRHLAETLDRDRRELSEMIAQQRPLERILCGISSMISHQDESLCCIPHRLVREGEKQRLQPVCGAKNLDILYESLGELGREVHSPWLSHEFRVSYLTISELACSPDSSRAIRIMACAAMQLGFQSCWSIPVVSSSQSPLGLLLVFSPRKEEATVAEKQLLEAGSRTAAIAIEHRYMTDLLAFQASHDCLTGLPNRSTFETRLEDAIAHARSHSEQLAVFYVDLDRFKDVNDTFGHAGGDELMKQVAIRLRRSMRHSDMLARIGGDEFSLLLPGLRDPMEANRVAESVLHAFQEPFKIRGSEVSVTSSIGISFYPQDGLDATTLQRNSDTAMYRVKNTGKNSFRYYIGDAGPSGEREVLPVAVH